MQFAGDPLVIGVLYFRADLFAITDVLRETGLHTATQSGPLLLELGLESGVLDVLRDLFLTGGSAHSRPICTCRRSSRGAGQRRLSRSSSRTSLPQVLRQGRRLLRFFDKATDSS